MGIKRKIFIAIIMIITTVNAFADGQMTITFNIPKYSAITEPATAIDYTIGSSSCNFPKICNADMTYPYIPKQVTLAPVNGNPAPVPPEWKSVNWQCTTPTCMNTAISQGAVTISSAEIKNNYIYATILNGTKAVDVLQTSTTIPAGWTCSVNKDPNTQAAVLNCSATQKTVWLCQTSPSSCQSGKFYWDFDCNMGVTQFSLVVNTLTPTGNSAGIGIFHFEDTEGANVNYNGASFSGTTLSCNYSEGSNSWTGTYDVSALKNCSSYPGGVQCDPN